MDPSAKVRTKNLELEKKKSKKQSVEKLFFLYAMPCMSNLKGLGRITEEQYKFILNNFIDGKIPSKEELESIFSAAFRRIKIIAKEMKKDYWDEEVIIKYWREGKHNKFIDSKEGTYAMTSKEFNEFCKVHKARVIKVKKDSLIVQYNNKNMEVSNLLLPDAEAGNIVTIHLGCAIEKIN